MTASQTTAGTDQKAEGRNSPSRRCLVTGETRLKEELIRFVASPDGAVIPDLAGNLPGRGLWVTADHAAVAEAARKGLFSKAAKTSLKADPGLADLTAALLKKRCLELLGLARSAGIAVLGQPQVEAALKAGKISLLLLAMDAGTDLALTRGGRETKVSRAFDRNELGTALGHDQLVYIGLKAHGLTAKLQLELARLEKMAQNPHITNGKQ